MSKKNLDLSIYLVTNSEMVPNGISFLDQVSAAIDNGVTLVQLREKNLDTRTFIERAKQVKKLTDKAGIPLIINDRVDIALAVDAHLHVGQSDMDAKEARQILGDDKIIGVSASTIPEIEQAIKDGADYVGIGICYDTTTKKSEKIPMGPIGSHPLLEVIKKSRSGMKACLIGGINQSNIQKVRYGAGVPGLPLDGVAVVSCIMAKEDAGKATRELVDLWNTPPVWTKTLNVSKKMEISEIIKNTRKVSPMCHNITNGVAKHFAANVTLAVGASPIMSECYQEFDDLAAFPNTGLVLNTGTATSENIDIYLKATAAYNKVEVAN
ncbi:unnamed protein product [Ambrosiozyma monospora]|uniref:Unnamed protein product n=1 Tax=Ambrosiozyma monospora TaxID=43982 RepID=A0A9W6Z4Y7_AMBMO|nr:unnamed protein product [Ambrosiozyma monospora]